MSCLGTYSPWSSPQGCSWGLALSHEPEFQSATKVVWPMKEVKTCERLWRQKTWTELNWDVLTLNWTLLLATYPEALLETSFQKDLHQSDTEWRHMASGHCRRLCVPLTLLGSKEIDHEESILMNEHQEKDRIHPRVGIQRKCESESKKKQRQIWEVTHNDIANSPVGYLIDTQWYTLQYQWVLNY